MPNLFYLELKLNFLSITFTFVKNRILLIFQGKNTKFFDTKTYFQSQISAYFEYVFFLQANGFLSNGSSIPSLRHICRNELSKSY